MSRCCNLHLHRQRQKQHLPRVAWIWGSCYHREKLWRSYLPKAIDHRILGLWEERWQRKHRILELWEEGWQRKYTICRTRKVEWWRMPFERIDQGLQRNSGTPAVSYALSVQRRPRTNSDQRYPQLVISFGLRPGCRDRVGVGLAFTSFTRVWRLVFVFTSALFPSC